jgi:hypothetical protein
MMRAFLFESTSVCVAWWSWRSIWRLQQLVTLFKHTQVDCWKMCPSVLVFKCGFNSTVLHHVTAVKCVNGCPKIILRFNWSRRWSSCFLACELTWLSPLVFPVGIFDNQGLYASTVDNREELWRRIQQFASEIKNTPGIFERLRVYFFTQSWAVCPFNMKAVSSISCKKVKIKRLLIALLFISLLYATR